MKHKILSTSTEKMNGVKGRNSLDPDEVYIFLNINPSTMFHMRQVPFPLDIAFLDQHGGILDIQNMEPEHGTAKAPHGTVHAVEASKDYFKANKLNVGDLWKELYNLLTQKEY